MEIIIGGENIFKTLGLFKKKKNNKKSDSTESKRIVLIKCLMVF